MVAKLSKRKTRKLLHNETTENIRIIGQTSVFIKMLLMSAPAQYRNNK
jgi:hypothetical protein